MVERPGVITMKGNPLTLVGQEVQVGDLAPDFEVIANDLSPFKLSSLKGKVAIICSVPSLDTPTCDIETRWFNEEAAKLGPDVLHSDHQHGPALRPEALVRRRRGGAGEDLLGPPGGGFRPGLRGLDQGTAAPGPGRVRGG